MFCLIYSTVVTRTSSEDLSVRLYTNVELDKVANLSAIPLALFVEVSLSPLMLTYAIT